MSLRRGSTAVTAAAGEPVIGEQGQVTKVNVITGFQVPKIPSAPTAAGLDKVISGEKLVLIVDSGVGNSYVSLMCFKSLQAFDVLAMAGDTPLESEDFDSRLLDHFIEEIKRKFKTYILEKERAVCRLRLAAKRPKRILSLTAETSVEIDALFDDTDFYIEVTVAKLEDLGCLGFFKNVLEPIQRALDDAKTDKIELVLVEGSRHNQFIQKLDKEFFNKKELCHITSDGAITCGAAVSAILSVATNGYTAKGVNVLDVAPLCFGIETYEGVMTKIIDCNTKVPCKTSKPFTTCTDDQTRVTVQMHEGERTMITNNLRRCHFEPTSIRLVPRDVPMIDVIYEVDDSGILDMSTDESTGHAQVICVTN